MTLIELKKSIHEKADRLDDIFEIPEHMKPGIEQGQRDIKNGNTFTLNDFEEKYPEWLKK